MNLNKRRLITIMSTEFEVHQAQEDADAEIVRTALSKSSTLDQVFIVGEDIDLLVLLNGSSSGQVNVYFQKGGKSGSECTQYQANSFLCENIEHPRGRVLFLHAISGIVKPLLPLFWQDKMK